MRNFKIMNRSILSKVFSGWLLKPSHYQIQKCRKLISQDTLKINTFIEARKNTANATDSEDFKNILKGKCADENNLIFIDDFRKMLKIASTNEDLETLILMLKKFNSQKKIVRFGSYSAGPEIMRLFYILNKPSEALKLIQDPELCVMFSEMTCIVVLADLLLKNEMYDDIIKLFHYLESLQFHNRKYPSNAVILYYAACFKLNNTTAYEDAKKTWEKFLNINYRAPERAVWFFAGLALKQNEPDFTLDIIKNTRRSAILENIEVIALTNKKQFLGVLHLLENIISCDQPYLKYSKFITSDTLNYVEQAFTSSSQENIKKLEKIKTELMAHNFVNEETLEALLFEEIKYTFKKPVVFRRPF